MIEYQRPVPVMFGLEWPAMDQAEFWRYPSSPPDRVRWKTDGEYFDNRLSTWLVGPETIILQVAPEPGAFVLAMFAAAGLLACLWGRRRS